MQIRKRVIYSGHVQGVGFRYTAHRLAQGLDVTGYVKNLPTGQVELVAEGEPDLVEALLERVANQMAGYIRNADIVPEVVEGLRGFHIRH